MYFLKEKKDSKKYPLFGLVSLRTISIPRRAYLIGRERAEGSSPYSPL